MTFLVWTNFYLLTLLNIVFSLISTFNQDGIYRPLHYDKFYFNMEFNEILKTQFDVTENRQY